jgi:hypothetical protein
MKGVAFRRAAMFRVSIGKEMRAWIRSAARLGHVSTGAVYLVVGIVALSATIDVHVRVTGAQGALHRLLDRPLGVIAVIGIAVGLIADACWQMVRAATDADRAGAGLRGWAERGGWIVSGVVHFGLAVAAIKLVVGIPQTTSEAQAKEWVALLLFVGPWAVGAIALGVGGVAVFLLYRAWVGDVDKQLDLRQMTRAGGLVVLGLGALGLVARAVVYGVIAWFLMLSAVTANSLRARGLGGAFRAIGHERYGPPLLAAIALGFIANGLVEILRARYRRIRVG